jgi:preprotein translocase subunit SecD
MFKSNSSKLILITIFVTICTLISLPKIPIEYYHPLINISTSIGGYSFKLGNNLYDFRDFKKGLDIEGGMKIVINLDMSQIPENERDLSAQTVKDIVDKRVNLFGVSETESYISKSNSSYRLTLELPGHKDIEGAVSAIGSTAQLKFRSLKEGAEWPPKSILEDFNINNYFEDSNVSGIDLVGSEVIFDPTTNQPVIQLKFSNEGRQKFSELVKKNVEKPLGIFLDNQLIQAPIVSKDLASGVVNDPTITGVTLEEGKQISNLLKAGALPVPIEIIEQNLIGAALGEDVIFKSLIAGALALIIIFIFFVFSYGRLGLIAIICLVSYISIVLAIFKLSNIVSTSGVVLTIPGIAGFLFSVGVACDASILIFERIKEELRWGRGLQLAIASGYQRAWSSIKDSNYTTFLASLILFIFGTGFVKGFALTLMIGIVVSLITNVYFSRIMTSVFIKRYKA